MKSNTNLKKNGPTRAYIERSTGPIRAIHGPNAFGSAVGLSQWHIRPYNGLTSGPYGPLVQPHFIKLATTQPILVS